MSQTTLNRVEPLRTINAEEARIKFASIAAEHDDKYDKGSDIARAIIQRYLSFGMKPERSPIFSLVTPNTRLDGFLDVFGENATLETLQTTGPVVVSSCAVSLELVTKTSELNPHELEYMLGRLPAVRINFIPEEY